MQTPSSTVMDWFLTALHWAILAIEVLVAVCLTALAAGALVSLGVEMWTAASSGHTLTHMEFTNVMAGVLQVFILVELFRIAIAYMKHENVIPTVLEAGLVAVARKFVVFEGGVGTDSLFMALGLASLLLAVAVSWWLLAKSNVCTMEVES
jgi:uncharacterized membrane protein (DUF373 family)